jgi:polyphenol oxidase
MRVTCPELSKLPGVAHGFFTRQGGVSQGPYMSLNCGYGSGDAAEAVSHNRFYVARTLGFENTPVNTAYQIHSSDAVVVKEPWAWESAPKADALVTNVPGVIIGVLTADCLPILLADPQAKVVAAVHAGWKGAFGGVIETAVKKMLFLGARLPAITATVGPAIAQCSYEVGPEFRDQFLAQLAGNEKYFGPSSREGHFMFDLKTYAFDRLRAAGIPAINVLAHDTCLEENAFFSYRRACQRGEPVYGRQVSAIVLKE